MPPPYRISGNDPAVSSPRAARTASAIRR